MVRGQRLAWADALAGYREALSRFEDWGIAVADGSRLRALERNCAIGAGEEARSAAAVGEGEPLLALREVDELTRIVGAFPDGGPRGDARRRLTYLAGDRGALPPGPGARPLSVADVQYELFLHSELREAGAHARVDGPGLVVSLPEASVGLVARRPDVLRPGDGDGGPGGTAGGGEDRPVVAVSLDRVLHGGTWRAYGPSSDEVEEDVRERMRRFVARNVHDVARRVEGRDAVAAVISCRVPGRTSDCGVPLVVTDHWVQDLAYSREEEARVAALRDALEPAPPRG